MIVFLVRFSHLMLYSMVESSSRRMVVLCLMVDSSNRDQMFLRTFIAWSGRPAASASHCDSCASCLTHVVSRIGLFCVHYVIIKQVIRHTAVGAICCWLGRVNILCHAASYCVYCLPLTTLYHQRRF